MGSLLNPQERLDWLRLIRTDSIGPITFYALLRQFGSAAAAIEALPAMAQRGGKKNFKLCPRAEAEREMAAVTKRGGRLIAWGEPDYPPYLSPLDDAPPLLTLLGNPHLLTKRAIGVVGARNASAAGQRFAREIAWDLGRKGFLIVSGLARGIDAASHGGSLDSGTAAVVGGGVDIVYPEENRALYDEIAARGAVIAECPLGTVPQARHFPRRNRLISGMSLGILVVEAALKSGSLITARFAADQGREVFAVPGSPLDPRCRGTNDLIRHGAVLVESAEDILNAIGGKDTPTLAEDRRRYAVAPSLQPSESDLARAHRVIGELLGPTAIGLDELVRASGLGLPLVTLVLLELELAGKVERKVGNRFSGR